MSEDYNIQTSMFYFKKPEYSECKCYIIGRPVDSVVLVFHPTKGTEPNRFHRFMQWLCFGFLWVKDHKNDK